MHCCLLRVPRGSTRPGGGWLLIGARSSRKPETACRCVLQRGWLVPAAQRRSGSSTQAVAGHAAVRTVLGHAS